jgi:beta-lactamase regulating signal transducer with metallopeptidase domain/polyhydroxyalkanoate synthesis regulator phasin
MIDLLLKVGLSNVCISLALAIVAIIVQATIKRPHVVHLLWLLVFIKLITPPIVTIPVAAIPNQTNTIAAVLIDETTVEITRNAKAVSFFSADTLSRVLEHAKPWLSLTWLLGSVLVFAWSLIRIYRFNYLLGLEAEVAPQELQATAAKIASRLGLKKIPTIYTTPAHLSPMVWWIGGKVRIVVPAALHDQMDTQQFQWILAHELAHVRRRDYLVRWLEWLACICFWWNPVVWWARHNLRANEELCCDALVVSNLKPKARTYGSSLLQAVEYLACPALRPPAMASEINSGGFLERRFTMIVSGEASRRKTLWLQACVLLFAVAVLPFGLAIAGESKDDVDIEARISTAVESGMLTREQAKTILENYKKELKQKEEYLAFTKQIKAAVDAGEMTKKEAGFELQAYKQDMKKEKFKASAAEIQAAIDAGEISEKEGQAKLTALKEYTAQIERGEEGDRYALKRRISAAIEQGKITPEEAKVMYKEYQKLVQQEQKRKQAAIEAKKKAIEEAVKKGEISREQANKMQKEIQMQMNQEQKREEAHKEAIMQRIEGDVERGEMTREEADAKYKEYQKQKEIEQKRKQAELESKMKYIEEVVKKGEMTKEEADKHLKLIQEQMQR